ncbi:MAG: sialate O-acetylesterase [Bacteroidales bacterium]
MKKIISVFLFGLLLTIPLNGQSLKLGELFNEGAVLQRNSKIAVWGTSAPKATVTLFIQDKQIQTKSNSDGKWSLELSKLKEGGPYSLTVVSVKDTIRLKEVYLGEVWIAGGQSNMAFMLQNSDNGKDEISQAKNTNIRFVLVPFKAFDGDKNRGDMRWRTATTENVATMSSVAYYFAKELQAKLNVPIGVICCYKGGSGAETWMSRESILKKSETAPLVENYDKNYTKLGKEKYFELLAKYNKDLKRYNDTTKEGRASLKKPNEPMGEQNYNRPGGLYGTMLNRVFPYTAKGVIWYQGEHNSPHAAQYRTLFPAMIEQWRTDFRNPNLPFLFVQLPSYANASVNNSPTWPELRDAQLYTFKTVKNTGMAVTIDLGEKTNIHPTHKEPVGKRLSAIALNQVYGFDNPYSGPLYKNVEIKGNQAIVSFDFVTNGFKVDGELLGFTICGEDHTFFPAKAEIKGNQLIVYAGSVPKPEAVRYGWENWTEANLKNGDGFLASPFRTDNFPLITDK